MRISRFVVVFVVALFVAFVAPSTALADPVKCKAAIVKASSQYVQARTKALQKCEAAKVGGKLPLATDCSNETKTDAAIDKAKDKMEAAIDKSCGGADKDCGSGGDDDPLASIGWAIGTCPDIESLGCTMAIDDCHDVSECLECIASKAVDQAVQLYYDDLVLPSANKDLNKCQKAIGKAGTQFLAAKTKALAKCWAAVNSGAFAGPCPVPGDDKAAAAITKAEAKKIAAICKACGGDDKGCDQTVTAPTTTVLGTGGSDDLTPAAIGFPANCADLIVPGAASSCSQSIATLADIVECVDCITEFKVDCTDRLAVPWAVPYPGECNPGCGNDVQETGEICDGTDDDACPVGGCAPPTIPEACTCASGSFSLSAVAGADLDTGWTGIAHDQGALVGHLFDADTYDCSSGGPDTLCSFAARYDTPFFGPPLPLSSGGVPICVVNEVKGTTTGTLDLVTGDLVYDYALTSRVHSASDIAKPCPRCVGDVTVDDDVKDGTCDGGPNDGGPCDTDGVSVSFGAVSFDCMPDPGGNIGNLSIVFDDATTGTKIRTTSASSPICTGVSGPRCLCDTCNNAAAGACTSNADCPISGGNPGVCGGRRCLGGTNNGAPCTNNSACLGGGSCGRPGQPTQPTGCVDDSLIAGDGTVCMPVGGDEGVCPESPIDTVCAAPEQFRTCTFLTQVADCPITGTCLSVSRNCFLPTVTRTGSPGLAGGSYAGEFCIPPTTAGAVNTVAGLPGYGTIILPYTLTISVP